MSPYAEGWSPALRMAGRAGPTQGPSLQPHLPECLGPHTGCRLPPGGPTAHSREGGFGATSHRGPGIGHRLPQVFPSRGNTPKPSPLPSPLSEDPTSCPTTDYSGSYSADTRRGRRGTAVMPQGTGSWKGSVTPLPAPRRGGCRGRPALTARTWAGQLSPGTPPWETAAHPGRDAGSVRPAVPRAGGAGRAVHWEGRQRLTPPPTSGTLCACGLARNSSLRSGCNPRPLFTASAF